MEEEVNNLVKKYSFWDVLDILKDIALNRAIGYAGSTDSVIISWHELYKRTYTALFNAGIDSLDVTADSLDKRSGKVNFEE